MHTLHILHLEDDPLDAELVLARLEEEGFDCIVTRVETRSEFLAALSDAYDLILADYSLPMFDGMDALRLLREKGLTIPFILLSGALGEDVAIESLKQGATDYVLKQRLERIAPAVRRALREAQERRQRAQAEEELQQRAAEIEELNARLQRAVAESHHRIKNNLQVLAALVDMQRMNAGETVPVAELDRLGRHIRTLASLHDMLTLDARADAHNLETISLKAALEKLIPMLQAASGGRRIQLTAEDARIPLNKCGSFCLLVNELVSNAIKHGRGEIAVSLSVTSVREPEEGDTTRACLSVCDDGPGFPPDFDPKRSANTGIELIESLGRWDLSGMVRYMNLPTGGACVRVDFSLASFSEASEAAPLPAESIGSKGK